jgi:hypothetical protein
MIKPVLAAIACCLACAAAPLWAQSALDKKDHDELRALLATFTKAFNSGDLDPLAPYLHRNLSVTMVNQDVVTNPKELRAYLDKMLRSDASPLKDVKIAPEPDIQTVFLEGRFGVNRGGSVDTYTLKDGRVYTLNTRWTGTAIQEGGRWKVLNAHIGLNILDNPILDAVEKMRLVWGASGLLVGLLLGAGSVLLLRRRRPAA